MKEILLVEDTPSLRLAYETVLRNEGVQVRSAESAVEGLRMFREFLPDILVLDLILPDGDGLKLMEECLRYSPTTSVIVVTANRSVTTAVEAMRKGAFDFLVKPFEASQLLIAVRNARAERDGTASEISGAADTLSSFGGFIGSSPEMQTIYARVRSASRSMATVFISGEPGTGMGTCARCVHDYSPRASGPFVRFGCAETAPERQESELFGHLRGAFVGALSDRVGAATQADGGTLFIDNVCALSPLVQTRLLRLLQTNTIQPIGATSSKKVNLRLICATDRDPMEEVRAGRFRLDLYYRLNVVPIHLPPVRDRGQDVLAIAKDALQKYARDEGKNLRDISREVQQALLRHDWPGNTRQVMSVMHNIAVLHDGFEVTLDMLPPESGFGAGPSVHSPATPSEIDLSSGVENLAGLTLAEIERQVIEACIARHGGSVTRAALELDVAPSTLYRKRAGWGVAGQG